MTVGQATQRPDRGVVLSQLSRLLESRSFARSQRRRAVLSYLVNTALDSPDTDITERTLGVLIYGREDFDPTQDAIVRVEMSRVRAGLEAFYAAEGKQEALRISFPRRSYLPVFEVLSESPESLAITEDASAPEPVELPPVPPTLPSISPVAIALAVCLALLITIGLWFVYSQKHHEAGVIYVTSLPGTQVQPTLSPDHNLAAFTWDESSQGRNDVFIKPIHGGSLKRLTSLGGHNRSPQWSPDGKLIAFLHRAEGYWQEVYLANPDGGNPRLLTRIGTTVAGIAWTPDSRFLVVPDSNLGQGLALFLVEATNGKRTRLTEFASFFHPNVSPDGRTLAFVRAANSGGAESLNLMPLGPDYRPSGPVENISSTTAGIVRWPTWSPNGESILLFQQQEKGFGLTRLQLRDRRLIALDSLGPGVAFGHEFGGGTLLTRKRETSFLSEVQIPEPGDPLAEARPLFSLANESFNGSRSPDGRKTAFDLGTAGALTLRVIDQRGRSVTVNLPPGVEAHAPIWAPNSTDLYIRGIVSRGRRAWRIFHAGVTEDTFKGKVVLAKELRLSGADDINPSVSRDGKALYFASNRNGGYQIWRVAVSPEPIADPKLVTAEQTPDELTVYAEESPTGDALYYTHGAGIWQLSLNDGSRKQILDVPASWFRVADTGIYQEPLNSGSDGGIVYFHPFAAGAQKRSVTLPRHRSWSVLPNSAGLLVTFFRSESNIEIHR